MTIFEGEKQTQMLRMYVSVQMLTWLEEVAKSIGSPYPAHAARALLNTIRKEAEDARA